MTKPNDPAYPTSPNVSNNGLTKREIIAKDILCSTLSNPEAMEFLTKKYTPEQSMDAIERAIENSIQITDLFIKQLNK